MGLSSDWDSFGFDNLHAFNADLFEWDSLQDWAKKFTRQQCKKSRNFLIGYSLGGRLALHTIIQDPSLWKGAIIISAHPGLSNLNERAEKIHSDEKWAKRFENEEWQILMNDWNAQAVFKNGNFDFHRKEENYCRKKLAHTLRFGSLGTQRNLKKEISELDIPILWITGAKDKKYRDLAYSMDLKHPSSQNIIIENAGHRAPWEQPLTIKKQINEFLMLKK